MPTSAVDAKADASAQAKQERKLAKKARKVQELQLKEAAEVHNDTVMPGGESAAQGKKKNKKDRELRKQLLELEKKRHQHLAELKKIEAQVQQMLEQADDADKVAKWVAKAIEETLEDGAGGQSTKIMPDDDDVSDADSSAGKKTDTVTKDAVDAPTATSEKTDGEKKKKKKDKKKSKSTPEEASAVEGQAADGKRKRQDDNAEQPVSKKGKKAKESKGGQQEAHASAEEVKIEGLEGGKARQDKFLRLLGGKKAGVSAAKPGSMASKNTGNSVRAEAAIQQQFEAGMALKESGQKRRGLGA
ncbi:hypothetical protein CCMA1212_002439 [Trichoderma ghanense]|uniref:Small acidic protein-like domain-containing protein n=1 Tax=Trichoderma ghanense TaxID=65468 RepID=A0ABY2HA23_9HYPO